MKGMTVFHCGIEDTLFDPMEIVLARTIPILQKKPSQYQHLCRPSLQ